MLILFRLRKVTLPVGEDPQATTLVNDSHLKHERLNRDERQARELELPFTAKHVITCSMEEFCDLLNARGLNEAQVALCRDIRRRGKNKVTKSIYQSNIC